MSEWSGYFRRAVANVEQRLDQALQDSQEVRLPVGENAKEPSPKPKDSEKENDQTEFHVTSNFTDPPDLNACVLTARGFVLALGDSVKNNIKDDGLDLVESLERAAKDTNDYVSSTSDRLSSLHSKIEKLVAAKGDFGSDKDKQIAMLFDEGQRLSERELKLSQQVKKLRFELSKATEKAQELAKPEIEARDQKIQELDKEIFRLRGHIVELEAALEHLRISGQETNTSETSSSINEFERRLESAQASHVAAQASWREVELGLLNRIASLENDAELHHNTKQALQQRILDAQAQARDARNLTVTLQDQLDEERRQREEVENSLSKLKNDLISKGDQAEYRKDKVDGMAADDSSAHPNDTDPQQEEDIPSPKHEIDNETSSLHELPSIRAEISDQNCEEPVLDRFIDLGPTEPPVLSRDTESHRGGQDDQDDQLPSLLEVPTPSRTTDLGRRDSYESVVDGQGASMQMVRRLTSAVRRLESELAATKRNLELATGQREQTQREMVELVDAQDDLIKLRQEYAALESALKENQDHLNTAKEESSGRAERISELQADVQDLKDMYREQVEALVAQIETLKA